MELSGGLRVARGLVVAGLGAALPVFAHVTAGGAASVTPLTAAVIALVAMVCVNASARPWTAGRLIVVLSLTQLAVHGSLAMSHRHGVAHEASSSHMSASGPMLLTHAAALLLTVLLLRQIDQLVLWILDAAQRFLSPPRLPTLAVIATVGFDLAAQSPGLGRTPRTDRSRGPPALALL